MLARIVSGLLRAVRSEFALKSLRLHAARGERTAFSDQQPHQSRHSRVGRAVCAIGCVIAYSCVNPYGQFYRGDANARLRRDYDSTYAGCQVYPTANFQQDAMELVRRGFLPIGQSSFNAGINSVSESDVLGQARRVGAHAVLVASTYTHTVSGAIPLSVPQSSTTYSTASATAYGPGGPVSIYGQGVSSSVGNQTVMMPYSVARGDFAAMFFIKAHFRLGAIVVPPDDNTRRRLGTNSAVVVSAVVQDSPAFLADIFPGDVILQLDAESVHFPDHFSQLLEKREGRSVQLKVERGGVVVSKRVELRALPATSAPPKEMSVQAH